eukprot:scaffold95286_cov60-Phaeocystis_antarctica.AAC.9
MSSSSSSISRPASSISGGTPPRRPCRASSAAKPASWRSSGGEEGCRAALSARTALCVTRASACESRKAEQMIAISPRPRPRGSCALVQSTLKATGLQRTCQVKQGEHTERNFQRQPFQHDNILILSHRTLRGLLVAPTAHVRRRKQASALIAFRHLATSPLAPRSLRTRRAHVGHRRHRRLATTRAGRWVPLPVAVEGRCGEYDGACPQRHTEARHRTGLGGPGGAGGQARGGECAEGVDDRTKEEEDSARVGAEELIGRIEHREARRHHVEGIGEKGEQQLAHNLRGNARGEHGGGEEERQAVDQYKGADEAEAVGDEAEADDRHGTADAEEEREEVDELGRGGLAEEGEVVSVLLEQQAQGEEVEAE